MHLHLAKRTLTFAVSSSLVVILIVQMFWLLFTRMAITLIVISSVWIVCYLKYSYSYWKRRGVSYLKPTFPFGNFGKNFRQKLSVDEQFNEFYRSTTEPFVGVYILLRPILIPRDPNFIRNILIKDFQHFSERGVYVDEKNDPISANLFSLSTDQWKNLRVKLTPTFTSGKMKAIFTTLLDCKNPLLKYMDGIADSNKTVEVRELAACYTTNAIASIAFGIEIDCFADPNNPFRKYGRRMFETNLKNAFRVMCFIFYPKLLTWSGIPFLDCDVEEFLFDMVKQTLELREKHKIVRNDFFQLLIQLRNTGNVQLDDEWQTVISNKNNKTMTIEQMTAQAFAFYLAGFETSSSTMAFCMFEIAKNPDVQRKIHEEIDNVLDKNNGQFTYDSINELKYLECCIDESLRKYPVIPMLFRECTKEYTIPGTNVTLEKGTTVMIPTFSLHRDEKYYPNPMKFDPSRFFSENKSGKSIIEMPYLPFGDGPRNCIGMRMGKMSTKVGVASLLQKYCVALGHQHDDQELKFLPASGFLAPTNGVHLIFESRI